MVKNFTNKTIEKLNKLKHSLVASKIRDYDSYLTDKILSIDIEARNLIYSSISMIVVLLILAGTTYAWLAISRTPIVSNIGLSILTESSLRVAFDEEGKPGEWQHVLNFGPRMTGLAQLKTCTYSKENNSFYAAEYDIDGRISNASHKLSDTLNSNISNDSDAAKNNYYITETFWVRSDSESQIALSEAAEVNDGIAGTGTYLLGLPKWDEIRGYHVNGAKGLENAARVGILCVETDLECNSTGNSRFIIYEPNSDEHIDGSKGYINTPSIDGGNSLVPEEDLIVQTTNSWEDKKPAVNNELIYKMGEFEGDTTLFKLTESTMYKVTVYIWIEGNDVDCNNAVSTFPTDILVNLQIKSIRNTTDDTELETIVRE